MRSKRHNVEFNVLTVVTAQTAKHGKDVNAFFMRHGLVYQQYIAASTLSEGQGETTLFADADALRAVFKGPVRSLVPGQKAGTFVYNRFFENLAALLLDIDRRAAILNGVCSIQYAIEGDGSVYPCDFYMLDGIASVTSTRLGVEEIERNREHRLSRQSALCRKVQETALLQLCGNGSTGTGWRPMRKNSGLNYFCERIKEFLPVHASALQELLR
jgi:uncharacterized protein